MTDTPNLPPEVQDLSSFLSEMNKETDRGAALVAASYLEERLLILLENFMIESADSSALLRGRNAPLGTFSARNNAAYCLGLLNQHEYDEIEVIRKIRNEFGHKWRGLSFDSQNIRDLTANLPWRGPPEVEATRTPRVRFNFATSLLMADLMWRTKLVNSERRALKVWKYTLRT